MKSLHLSIVTAAGIGAVVTLGIVLVLTMHGPNNTGQSNVANYPVSMLAFAMSINSTNIKVGDSIGIDISLANTSPNTLTVPPQHNWPLKKWSLGPCLFQIPFGMALMQGNYDTQNMTEGQRLLLYPRGVYMCRPIGIVNYIFEPSSTTATIDTYNSTNIPVTLQFHVAFNGFYQGQKFQPFTPGIYTVVGDDQWGHIAINHFTVTSG